MVRAKDLLGLGSESESGFMNQRSGSWSAVNRQGQVQGYGRGQGSGGGVRCKEVGQIIYICSFDIKKH